MAVVLFFVGLAAALLVYSRWYVKVPPNQAFVVYGGKRAGSHGFRVITGHGIFVRPILDSYKVLSLAPVQVVVEWDLLTKDGREVRVEVLCNVAVGFTFNQMKFDRESFAAALQERASAALASQGLEVRDLQVNEVGEPFHREEILDRIRTLTERVDLLEKGVKKK